MGLEMITTKEMPGVYRFLRYFLLSENTLKLQGLYHIPAFFFCEADTQNFYHVLSVITDALYDMKLGW